MKRLTKKERKKDEETDHAALPVDGEQAGAAFQLDCALLFICYSK